MTAQMPRGWAFTTLGDIAEIQGGLAKGKKRKGADKLVSVPYLRVANVQRGWLDLREVKTIDATEVEIDQLRLRSGDILFNEGGDRDKLGRGWVWAEELPLCIHQNHVFRARLRTPEISSTFISMVGNSEASREFFLRRGKQSVNLASVSKSTLSQLPIPMPPPGEQRRIVAKIHALQSRSRAAREALDAIPPLIERFRQSVLAAAFRGDLTADWRAQNPDVEPASALLDRIRTERRQRWEQDQLAKMKAKGKTPRDDRWKAKYKETAPVEEDKEPDLPPGWTWVRLEELCSHIVDCLHRTPTYTPSGCPAIRTADVVPGRLLLDHARRVDQTTYQEQIARLEPQAGDVLYTREGERYGLAASVPEGVKLCMSQRMMQFRVERRVCASWFMWAMNSPGIYLQATRDVGGSTSPHVNIRSIRQFLVPVPPDEEQSQIAHQIEALWQEQERVVARVRDAASRLGALEASILARGFRGELVAQDPEDEPASALLDRINGARRASTSASKRRRPKTDASSAASPASADPDTSKAARTKSDAATTGFLYAEQGAQQQDVRSALLGKGGLELDAAVRCAAAALWDAGAADFKRLREGGPVYAAIESAIKRSVRAGQFDRPRRGHVRAILPDAKDYEPKHWRTCLLQSLNGDPTERGDAMRAAAAWAAENMGLEYTRLRADGVILQGLKSALSSAIRRKEIKRVGGNKVQLLAKG